MDWDTILEKVKQLLTDNLIDFKFDGNGEFKVASTDFSDNCTIEVTGTPWKPEYWVNDMKCRFEEIVECVEDCQEIQFA